MPINLARAARIGLLEEMLIQIFLERTNNECVRLSTNQQQLLCDAIACTHRELIERAMSLIGEENIADIYIDDDRNLCFVRNKVIPIELPIALEQNLRQHGITIAFARELYSHYTAIGELSEDAFIRLCIREQGAHHPMAISKQWQPSAFCRAGLAKRGVTPTFIDELVPEFILIFNESPRAALSIDLEFFRFAAARWQRHINAFDESTDFRPLPQHWRPSRDVIHTLEKEGYAECDIEAFVPLFRLTMHERGVISRNWGKEFVKQWVKHSARSPLLTPARNAVDASA